MSAKHISQKCFIPEKSAWAQEEASDRFIIQKLEKAQKVK